MPLNHACQPETELETNPPSIARGARGVETFRRGGAFLEFEFLIRFLSLCQARAGMECIERGAFLLQLEDENGN